MLQYPTVTAACNLLVGTCNLLVNVAVSLCLCLFTVAFAPNKQVHQRWPSLEPWAESQVHVHEQSAFPPRGILVKFSSAERSGAVSGEVRGPRSSTKAEAWKGMYLTLGGEVRVPTGEAKQAPSRE